MNLHSLKLRSFVNLDYQENSLNLLQVPILTGSAYLFKRLLSLKFLSKRSKKSTFKKIIKKKLFTKEENFTVHIRGLKISSVPYNNSIISHHVYIYVIKLLDNLKLHIPLKYTYHILIDMSNYI